MKIIHLISGGDVGGAKTHVLSLLQGLGRTEQVRLVCFLEGPFAQEARELGIDTVVIASNHVFRIARDLAAEIRGEGYEVVHCHGSRANLIGTLLHRQVAVPVVTTVHSDYRLDYLGRPFHRLTYGLINSFCLRRLPYHIGVSNAMAQLLISRGFDPQTMFSIYNGVNFSDIRHSVERDAYFESVGLSAGPDSVVFGIAAWLRPVKDVGTLIRGFALAARRCPSARLLIAGDGEQAAELKKLAASLCPAGTVCFAGWVTDMDSFYHAIDVNTLTSLSETFPYALTEGARHGCATIASRVGGVPDLIEDGVTGLLFPPQDAEALAEHICTLVRDRALLSRLGRALFEKARRDFSEEATVEKQKEIYRVLIRRAQRPRGRRDGVLICGAYGKGNAGDDSILEAIIGQMRRIDPDMPLYVLTRTPMATKLRYGIGAAYTFDIPKFLHIMRHTRLYLNGGGSLIQDVTSTRSLRYYLASIRWAKKTGNRVLMYGCGIGPVNKPSNRRRAARVISRCVDAITLREDSSRDELSSMGVSGPEITVTADPALLLTPAAPQQVDGWFLQNGLDPHQAYVLLVLRPWQGYEEKAPAFAQAAAELCRRHGLKPVFLALEPGRDLPACRMAAEAVGSAPPVLSVPNDGRLIVGILGRMHLVVSMRLHALIFAAAAGTPVVGAVYDPKVQAFLDYLGQKAYLALEDVTSSSLLRIMEDALEQGARSAADVARLRALAAENEAAARRLLEESK
ncbi:MAG: polysaccharide pyruvyl transferase CsaB [Oscillospiraceae bacterium]|nr:polysaccharide pyruvyl transferase CsaB [Oscillospiraceae bacterium]